MQRKACQSIAILFSNIIINTIKYSTGLRGGRRQLSRFSGAAPQSGRTVHRSDHLSAFDCTKCATCVAFLYKVCVALLFNMCDVRCHCTTCTTRVLPCCTKCATCVALLYNMCVALWYDAFSSNSFVTVCTLYTHCHSCCSTIDYCILCVTIFV